MKTNTVQLAGTDAMRAIFAIDAARFGKLKVTEEFYSIKNKGRALLVEPVNGDPFVLIDDTAEPTEGTVSLPRVTRMEWLSEPRSGTDKLRARMHAQVFFDSLPDEPAPAVPTGELIVQQLRAIRRGPCQMHDQASAEAIEQEALENTPSP